MVYWNAAAEKMTGLTASEMLGKYCHELDLNGRGMCKTPEIPRGTAEKNGALVDQFEFIRHRDGHRVPVLSRMWAIGGPGEPGAGLVNFFSNLSVKAAGYEKIEFLQEIAFIDSLLNLANRRLAEIKLDEKVRAAKSGYENCGIIFFDVHNFKEINDGYGHDTGDRVIQFISVIMSESARDTDMIARWGGDEFLAIVENTDEKSLAVISECMRQLVAGTRIESRGDPARITNRPERP